MESKTYKHCDQKNYKLFPLEYRIWMFWTKVLNHSDTLNALQITETIDGPQSIRTIVERTFGKYTSCSPTECRGKSSTSRRNLRYFARLLYYYWTITCSKDLPYCTKYYPKKGLGIEWKSNLVLKKGTYCYKIIGFRHNIPLKHFKKLEQRMHPSLIEFYSTHSVFWGPLSLINHDCKSPLQFSNAYKTVKTHLPPFKTPKHFKRVALYVTKKMHVKASEELTVLYSTDTQIDDCKCNSCMSKQRKDTDDTDEDIQS